jgi:hypothetical protein
MNQITVTPPAARQTAVSLSDSRPVVSVAPRASTRQVLVATAEHADLAANFETLAQNLQAWPKVLSRDGLGRIAVQDFGGGRVIKSLVRDTNGRVTAITLSGTLLGQQLWTKVFERDSNGRMQGAHYTAGTV